MGALWVGAGALGVMGCPSAEPARTPEAAPLPAGVAAGRWPAGGALLPPEGHMATITCLSFSPDGRQLVSGSEDRTLLVWDVETGRVVQRLVGHGGLVGACAFFPDGRRVASGGWGGEVFVWDTATGERRPIGDLGGGQDVYSLALRSDGRELMVGTYYGEVRAWEVQTGQEAFRSDDLKDASKSSLVSTVGYLGDGRRFGGGGSGVTRIWGKQSLSIDQQPASGVALPGGRLLLGGYGEIVLVEPGRPKQSMGQHQGWVYGLAVNPRRDLVLAGDDSGQASVWSLPGGSRRCQLPRSARIMAAAFDPSGERFAVAGEDATIRLARTATCRDPASAVSLQELGTSRTRLRSAVAGSTILLGDGRGNISSWSRDALRRESSVQVHAGEVKTMALLPDGRWVSGGLDSKVVLTSPSGSKALHKLQNVPYALALGHDQQAVLAVDMGGGVTQIPLDGTSSTELFRGPRELYGLALRPTGTELTVGGALHHVYKLWLSRRGDPVASVAWDTANRGDGVTALAYDPDGRWLVEADTGGGVTLRNADDGHIERRLTGLHKQVSTLLVTRDHVWAGGSDQKLLRWPLTSGTEPDLLLDEGAIINGLALTPDARLLVAALEDGRASVRSHPDGKLIAHLLPLSDGSWATLYADGRYEASSQGEALSLLVEDPTTHRVSRLDGRPIPLTFLNTSLTSLDSGATLVRTTLISPYLRPTVTLDGRWPVRSVVPSTTAPLAYDVEIVVNDPAGHNHTLDARAENGETAHVDITLEGDLRFSTTRPRALVIGNETYTHVDKLRGAKKDAQDFANALRAEKSWRLADLKPLLDQGASSFTTTVKDFFTRAQPGETLLFYYAGHGTTAQGEGYLLPVDAHPADMRGALSARELWAAIRESKASRILVVLDACRSGSFLFPADAAGAALESLAGGADRKRVGLLAAANFGSNAADTAEGGAFTQALIKAMARADLASPLTGAVSAQAAFREASGAATKQRPRIFGSLDDLPLAWPKGERAAEAVPIGAAKGLLQEARVVGSRQVVGKGSRVEGDTLVVRLLLADTTHSVRVGLHHPSEKHDAPLRPETFHVLHGARGKETAIEVPLVGVARGRRYCVEIQPCASASAASCTDAPPVYFDLQL